MIPASSLLLGSYFWNLLSAPDSLSPTQHGAWSWTFIHCDPLRFPHSAPCDRPTGLAQASGHSRCSVWMKSLSQMKSDPCPLKEDQNNISVLPGPVGRGGAMQLMEKLTWQGRGMGQRGWSPAYSPHGNVFGGGLGLPLPHSPTLAPHRRDRGIDSTSLYPSPVCTCPPLPHKATYQAPYPSPLAVGCGHVPEF